MRLFTGLEIPYEVARRLEELIERLRLTAALKWSPPANLHITTKFIGEWPEARLGELKAALGALPGRGLIEVQVRKLGFFPNSRAPRVFWVGVEGGGELATLANETERALASLGVQPEQRGFSPHLTLSRIKEPVRLERLHEEIGRLPSLDFGSFVADRFHLYHSRPGRAGSVYTKISDFPFNKS